MRFQRLHFTLAGLACYSSLPGVVYTVEEITSVGSQTATINSRIQSFSSPKWTLQHQDVTSFFGLPFLSNSCSSLNFVETPILPYNSFFQPVCSCGTLVFILPWNWAKTGKSSNWVVPTNPPKLNESPP